MRRALRVIALFLLAGCFDKPLKPISLVAACDPTGARPDASCNTDVVKAWFTAWAHDAVWRPGSTFVLVMSGGDYGSTRVVARLIVPETCKKKDDKVARKEWITEGTDALDAVEIAADRPGDRTARSDLVSLLLVAAHEVEQLPATGTVGLLVATDGWYEPAVRIGKGDQLGAEPVLARLRDDGVAWSLRGADTLVVCGYTPDGATAKADARRRRFLHDLLVAGGAKSVTPRSSCVDVTMVAQAGD